MSQAKPCKPAGGRRLGGRRWLCLDRPIASTHPRTKPCRACLAFSLRHLHRLHAHAPSNSYQLSAFLPPHNPSRPLTAVSITKHLCARFPRLPCAMTVEALSSNVVNYLVWRYLQEAGMTCSCSPALLNILKLCRIWKRGTATGSMLDPRPRKPPLL